MFILGDPWTSHDVDQTAAEANTEIASRGVRRLSSLYFFEIHMEASANGGTPKSSTLIGVSITNHPFGGTPNSGNPHIALHTSFQQMG